jgi:hypothetical protein
VSTGQHLQCIHHGPLADSLQYGSIFERFFILKNTNVIVFMTMVLEDASSTMYIYDLEAMRNHQSAPREILCATVKVGQIILKLK